MMEVGFIYADRVIKNQQGYSDKQSVQVVVPELRAFILLRAIEAKDYCCVIK